MRDITETNQASDFGQEWRGMAQDVLCNSELSEHPALSRLQLHAQQGLDAVEVVGVYSKQHHRHNRT